VIGRTKDREIGSSGDTVTRSPSCCCSPDHPISRSPDLPIGVACFIAALSLGLPLNLQPSPPWGRGRTAAGAFISRGGPDERVGGLSPQAASGETSLQDFVHRFESSYHAVKTIRADFTQTYVTEGRTQIESGVVYFARGGLMRWDYQRPQPKLFLSDGKTLELYVPEEKQITRTALKASDDIRVPFRLLLSRLELRRVFSRIEFAPGALEHPPADRVLRGYPKQALQEDYRQVLMEITPQFDIHRLLVTLADQSTMEFDFDHIQRDVPLSHSWFQFVAPPGTEVIDQR
jgi:outer membrane lipoprotein carrier protein